MGPGTKLQRPTCHMYTCFKVTNGANKFLIRVCPSLLFSNVEAEFQFRIPGSLETTLDYDGMRTMTPLPVSLPVPHSFPHRMWPCTHICEHARPWSALRSRGVHTCGAVCPQQEGRAGVCPGPPYGLGSVGVGNPTVLWSRQEGTISTSLGPMYSSPNRKVAGGRPGQRPLSSRPAAALTENSPSLPSPTVFDVSFHFTNINKFYV